MMHMLFATIVSVGFLSYANAGNTCADCGSGGQVCDDGQVCCVRRSCKLASASHAALASTAFFLRIL
jgi:hypothetical protein